MSSAPEGHEEGAKRIKVRVLFFGAARDAAGNGEIELALNSGTTAGAAFDEVLATFPELRRFGRSLLFALNLEYAPNDRKLEEGDELAMFPPVSGGSDSEMTNGQRDFQEPAPATAKLQTRATDFFELTADVIDVGSVVRRTVLPNCGATVTLDGYAREWTKGRRTLYLIYEAYSQMALTEMRRLGRQAHELFEIGHIGIVHRTGKLDIGETSVVIAVSAPHRRAAFAACEWAIRELKRTVPIWKKEVFEDGEVWVEGEASDRSELD